MLVAKWTLRWTLSSVEMKPSSLLCPLLRVRTRSGGSSSLAVSFSAPLVLCSLVVSTLRRLFRQRASQAGRCAKRREDRAISVSEVKSPRQLPAPPPSRYREMHSASPHFLIHRPSRALLPSRANHYTTIPETAKSSRLLLVRIYNVALPLA